MGGIVNAKELSDFMTKYKMDDAQLAELIGLTKSAVNHWIIGRRSIAKPYGRLIRLFDRHPSLMAEFRQ